MKCLICNKPIKENKEGNNKYCQGHSILENPTEQKGKKHPKDEFCQGVLKNAQCDCNLNYGTELEGSHDIDCKSRKPLKQKGKIKVCKYCGDDYEDDGFELNYCPIHRDDTLE